MPEAPIVVLVVEDEPLIRMSVVADLEDANFVVYEASDAKEAISILEARRDISLVFTDVDMPGTMDGILLAAYVRDRWPPIRIIITSGQRNLGPDDIPTEGRFIPKPYQREEVVSMIETLLA
ncbi:response regulator [Rhizobium sp. SIMBA_035]